MPPDAEQRPTIDADLVRRLVGAQFPQWAGLSVREVDHQGWDNRTYRLGEELSVRLPSATGYVAAVRKEQRVLPMLAPHLPLPVPEPVGLGAPGEGYPFPWSVRRWIEGALAADAPGLDHHRFARDLGGFLRTLRTIDADEGPPAGEHSFHRGAHPSRYTPAVDAALDALADDPDVDTAACRAIWDRACATAWEAHPVWFHGDVAPTNLLVRDGRVAAVIDFGTCGVGDPACDLVIAWTFLEPSARPVFRRAVDLPDDAWERARGWVLWKTLIMLAGVPAGPGARHEHEAVLRTVLAEPMTA